MILWALVLIFATNRSAYNHSVCHKLLNMQNIYTCYLQWQYESSWLRIMFLLWILLQSFFWHLLFSFLSLLPQERQQYKKLRDSSNSPIVRVATFCILFNLYANSHNNTKLNYMATSVALLQVSHDAWSLMPHVCWSDHSDYHAMSNLTVWMTV